MVNLPIMPIKLAQVEDIKQITSPAAAARPEPTGNIFDQMLGRAVNALEGVSETEMNANRLIDDYVAGKAELSDVMLATSKMTIAVNLAVTAITTVVTSFKEITQMQI